MNKKVVIFILILVLVFTVVWAQNVRRCATRSCPQTKSECRANCAEQPYSSDVNCWKQPCSSAKCTAVCKGNKSRSKNETTSCSQQQCNRQCRPCPKIVRIEIINKAECFNDILLYLYYYRPVGIVQRCDRSNLPVWEML